MISTQDIRNIYAIAVISIIILLPSSNNVNFSFLRKNEVNYCVGQTKNTNILTVDASGRLSDAGVHYSLENALIYLDAPIEWKTNQELLTLIKRESDFNPSKQNEGSSAFGLFQMVRKTWDVYLPEVPYGVTDPVWQSIGGLRYIMKIYKTPVRAYNFRKATFSGDADMAPSDLQLRARFWIDNGLRGY